MKIVLNRNLLLFLLIFTFFLGCSTTKKKGELTKFQKFYHNTTSKYNGYFNAKELLNESILALEESNEDNYDELLNVFAYQSDNPEIAFEQLDRAIEKVSTVVSLHRYSKWVDDCYLLLGQAQYLKQDFESAEETFRFFQEEFESNNLYPTNSIDPNKSDREKKVQKQAIERKEKTEERKEKAEEREEDRKTRDEQRKEEKKAREKKKKQETKLRDQIKNLRSNLKKATKKRRDKEKKEKDKARKNKKRLPKKDPNKDYRSEKEKTLEAQIATKESELAELRGLPDAKTDAEMELEKKNETSGSESGGEADSEKETEKEEEITSEEKAEEESEDKEDEKDEDEGIKGGRFKHKPAYYEGLLWLARTYVERDNGFSSEYMLNNLRSESNIYDHVKDELPASYAHLFIKQKEYKRAINSLQSAIERSDDKFQRARYAYILGQLYERDGQTDKALAAFERSKNFKPKYEMFFHAALKQVTLSHSTGKISQDGALSKLGKMLKEDKNAEYRSQIKMAMGEIYLTAGNMPMAITHFQDALSESSIRQNKKSELYYKLASLFYNQEKYLEASAYYDSTLTVIDKENSKYYEVEKRAKNLQNVARNLQVIQLQDSLLMLASLTPDEQREIAEAEYERQLEEGATVKPELPTMGDDPRGAAIRKVGNGRSNFFAYNDIALAQGQRDFKRKWGPRALEDDWRRSDRAGATIVEELDEEELEEVDNELKEEEIKRMLANIPSSETRKQTARNRIAEAKYNLGVAYRDDVEDLEKSIKTLEGLLNDHPSFEKKSEVYYYLYLNYLGLKNQAKTDYYASKLKQEYPDSEYTKILFDENYIQAIEAEQNKEEINYKKAYAAFEAKNHAEVIAIATQADAEYGKDNDYAPKYALLSAMSTGSLNGKDEYIKALKSLTKKYPNTPEQVRANEILRFLDGKGDAFTSSLLNEEDMEAFTFEPDKLHYGIVLCYDINEKQMNDAKIDISNYNKKFFKLDKLKITDIYLNRDEKTQIILIRKFRNKEKADLFYNSVSKKRDEYIKSDIEYKHFVVTQKNYRELLKQKSVDNYLAWFEENYLKG